MRRSDIGDLAVVDWSTVAATSFENGMPGAEPQNYSCMYATTGTSRRSRIVGTPDHVNSFWQDGDRVRRVASAAILLIRIPLYHILFNSAALLAIPGRFAFRSFSHWPVPRIPSKIRCLLFYKAPRRLHDDPSHGIGSRSLAFCCNRRVTETNVKNLRT